MSALFKRRDYGKPSLRIKRQTHSKYSYMEFRGKSSFNEVKVNETVGDHKRELETNRLTKVAFCCKLEVRASFIKEMEP